MDHGNSHKSHYYILTAVFIFYFLILFAPFSGMGCDDIFYYSYISSPLFDGDLDVMNDYYLSNNYYPPIRNILCEIGPKGLVKNQFAIGSAVLWLPFHLPVRAFAWCVDLLHPSPPAWTTDRFSTPYLFSVSFPGLCYGYLTLILVYCICCRFYSRKASLVAALGAVFASPLNAYIFTYPATSHAPSAFCISLLLYVCLRHRDFQTLNAYLLPAGAIGLATIVRWQNALFAFIPLSFWIEQRIRQRRLRVQANEFLWMLSACAAFGIIVSLQCLYWYALYGKFLTLPQGSGFMKWTTPDFLHLLFSGWHGLFYVHPLMLFAFAGLLVYLYHNRRRPTAYAVVLCVALMTYVNASAIAFWTGGSYACRRFGSCTPLFALGLAAMCSLFRGRRLLIPALVTSLAMAADVFLQVVFSRGMFDAFFAREIWAIRGDVLHLFPRWLATVPLNSYAWAHIVLLHNYGRALLVIAIGLLLIGGLLLLILKGVFSRLEKRGVWMVWGLTFFVLVLDAALYVYSPPKDENGVLFSRIVPTAKEKMTAEERERIFQELLKSDYANPALYFWFFEAKQETKQLPYCLDEVYRISPELWAKWVAALPGEQVDTETRQKADGLLKKPLLIPTDIYNIKMAEARQSGRSGEERQWLKRYLRFNPFSPPSVHRLALIYREGGRYGDAYKLESRLRRFLEAKMRVFLSVEDKVGNWVIYLFRMSYSYAAKELGRMYETDGSLERASEVYETILSKDPADTAARERRLSVWLQTDDPEQVSAHLRLQIPNKQRQAAIVVDAAAACFDRGDIDRSWRILKTGLKDHPNDPRLAHWLRRVYSRFAAGEMPLEQLMTAELESPEYWLFVAEQLNAAERFEDSLPLLERIAAQRPNQPWLQYVYGWTLYNLRKLQEAEAVLRRALQIPASGSRDATAVLLSRVLSEQGKRDEALQILGRLLEETPENAAAKALKEQIESTVKKGPPKP